MPRIIWSAAARADLAAIDAYLAQVDPAVAVRMLSAIRATARRLEDYPRIGRAFDEPFRVLGVRGTPYLLIYRLTTAGLEIVRLRHGREDWLPRLEGEL